MLHALLSSLVVLASVPGEPRTDGTAWLEKSASHHYAWPKPGSLVHFQARTNMLEEAIAVLEKDPEVGADPEKARWVDALRNPTISCTLDTETGKVSTEVELRFEPTSPEGKAASAKMKTGMATMISVAFQTLPFQNPSLLYVGGSVLSVEEGDETVLVTLAGKSEKGRGVVHLNKRTELPEKIETAELSMRLRYVEVTPGRFAPSRFDVRSPAGKESFIEYTYQKAGELAFPASVRVSKGPKPITLTFVSLKVDPPAR